MENEEPNLVVPRPFPQDSTDELLSQELQSHSDSLDLTPERPEAKKNGLQRRKVWSKTAFPEKVNDHTPSSQSSGHTLSPLLRSGRASSPLPGMPAHLCNPHINSTARDIRKVQEKREEYAKNPASIFPNPYPISAEELHRLETAVRLKPLREVNVPYDATRYRDLARVGVSDESFEKLVFMPRKKWKPPPVVSSGEEPDIMDIMVPCLECEEADWVKTSSVKPDLKPEPLVMDVQDLYSLNSFTKSLR